MNYLIIGASVIVIRIIISLLLGKDKKERVIVLGREIAAADEKERQRIKAGNHKESPLPDYNYRKWKDEQSLINPAENELDASITQLCTAFISADENKKEEIRKSLNQDNIYTLLEFVKRKTVFAIRQKEPKHISNGFTAISMIESERCDYRDVSVTISFLDHGIQKLNLTSADFFENAFELSEQQTAGLMKGYYERSKKNKKIERAGGYVEIETPYGTGFVNTYFRKYNPEKNLVKILFEISDYLSKDKYKKGEITIGSDIDAVWFGERGNKNIERLNAKANGCAFVRSTLKEGLHIKSNEQVLHVFLTEFSNLNILHALKEKAENNKSSSFAWLCFSEDNLLCMVIQRATREGVEDYESNESLKRFEDGLRKIITTKS